MQNFADSFELAERLAKACSMTSPSAKKRLFARSVHFGRISAEGDYVPPKEFLMYLVR